MKKPLSQQWLILTVSTVTYHESLLNAKVIVDDFGQGGQAVGGAGGIAINRKIDTVTMTTRLTDTHKYIGTCL